MCGILGMYSYEKDAVSRRIYNGLISIQHRGQESAGISTFDGRFHLKKKLGLVNHSFTDMDVSELSGNVGLGHVRYPTVGTALLQDTQPFLINYARKGVVFGHNGNVVNYIDIKKELSRSGKMLEGTCDGEMIGHILADEVNRTNDLEKAVAGLFDRVEGACSGGFMTGEGELVAFRDPLGIRPFCWVKNDGLFMFSSETVAMDMQGIRKSKPVEPGEMVIASRNGVERKRYCPRGKTSHCFFEYVYFSRPDSVLDEKSVYDVRVRLGEELAKDCDCNADVIVPVPDTSRPAAEGLSKKTGIPVAEGLMKNRYIHRTFIMNDQKTRSSAVHMKLNPVKAVLKDKNVIMLDDSIVRGTTSKDLISLVRNAGAKRVDFLVTCPPIVSPCFYGIDISTHGELVAASHTVEEIKHMIKADRLCYQSLDGLIRSTGFQKSQLCTACLTGKYPTPLAQKMADSMGKYKQKRMGRYYEMESG